MVEKSSKKVSVVILAAGMGTRMKSVKSKVLHEVSGMSMVEIILNVSRNFTKETCVVSSNENKDEIENFLQDYEEIVIQNDRLGTAHACMMAQDFIARTNAEKVLILYADTPLITLQTLEKMVAQSSDLTCLGFIENDITNKYGRLVTHHENLLEIVEYKDATEQQQAITLCNSGVFCVEKNLLLEFFKDVKPSKATGEYYLTDIAQFASCNHKKATFIECDKEEVLGVNSREDLAIVDDIMQNRLKKNHMQNGVTFLLPQTTYISIDANIENDVTIENGCFIGRGCVIKSGAIVKSNSYLESCTIENDAIIGPFSRIREKTTIGKNAKIGNFVEVKKTNFGNNSKANHLSYIGDCDIEDNCNIGAGTVFCNYNGFEKFRSNVGKSAFIGSNSTIISPVEIGNGVIIGAGSVITKAVEENSLAVSRVEQKLIKDGATKFRNKYSK